MMKYVAIALVAVGLAGCQSVRGTGERWMSDEEVEAKDHGVCDSLGAKRGTQVYIDCRLRLRSDRSSSDSGRRLRAVLS